ncbi:metal-dependent hydrolase [Nocardiopsis potens]|uniref:metal-dependent hydrolase n=1 Tax=Nocardiopsis potens TaxID=1246458 RepID=UPI0003493072|nr:metal-dependent hydrolase [Nocardiopsis potens]
MAPSHAATGLLAGVLATAAAAPFMAVGPMELAAGAAIGAGAALLPDIDHPGSTATTSQGPLTRVLSAGARRLSAWVYHATLTRADTVADGEHRYLWHTPAAALATGAAVGAAGAASPWALGAVLWFTVTLALRGLAQALPRGRTRARLMNRAGTSLAGAAAAVLLVASGASPGPYVGAVLALGMVVHSLGDALTRSAVPLAWPFRVRGRRWAMIGTPRRLRFTTGSRPELVIRWACLAAAPLAWLALV